MSVQKQFESEAGTLTIQRPHYKAFRNIAVKVAGLLEVDFDVAMATSEFEQVLQACTVENIDQWLETADYKEAARLWDEIIELCEFDSFFAERRKQRSETLLVDQELQVRLQAAQINAMKTEGLLPENFSLESILSESSALNLNPMPSSSTSTPAGTVGTGSESSARTSGGSSGTSRKPRGGGKRSPN